MPRCPIPSFFLTRNDVCDQITQMIINKDFLDNPDFSRFHTIL